MSEPSKRDISDLCDAVRYGDRLNVEMYIELHGLAYIDARDDGNRTALIWSAIFGHTDIAELLLRHGADTQIISDEGLNAEGWANAFGYHDTVELLRQWGAVHEKQRLALEKKELREKEKQARLRHEAETAARYKELKQQRPPKPSLKRKH